MKSNESLQGKEEKESPEQLKSKVEMPPPPNITKNGPPTPPKPNIPPSPATINKPPKIPLIVKFEEKSNGMEKKESSEQLKSKVDMPPPPNANKSGPPTPPKSSISSTPATINKPPKIPSIVKSNEKPKGMEKKESTEQLKSKVEMLAPPDVTKNSPSEFQKLSKVWYTSEFFFFFNVKIY